MKAKNNILCLLFCLTALFSCTAEEVVPFEEGDTRSNSNLEQVMFSVSLPLHNLPSTTRSVSIDDDSKINSQQVTIWTFDGEGNDAIYKEEITSESTDEKGNKKLVITSGENGKQHIFVLLPRSETKVTLCMMVNATPVSPSKGESKAVACGADRMNYSVGTTANPLKYMPMYGECVLDGVKHGTKQNLALLRAMAKVEINASAISDIFKIESVQIYNVNREGLINGGDISLITNTVTNTEEKTDIQNNSATFYLPEIADLGNTNPDNSKKTFILVKASYKQAFYWYRLEFISSSDKKPIQNLQRNYKYSFVLRNVNGTGYSAYIDAMSKSAHNATVMKMEVQEIDDKDILEITTNGEFYLGMTSSDIIAKRSTTNGGYIANLNVVCNNPEGWTLVLNESGDYNTKVTLDKWKPSSSNVTEVQSIWFFLDEAKLHVDDTYRAYIYSGTIRKEIFIKIIAEEV